MTAALIAAVVTIAGWYVTYFYTKRREDRTRRTEAQLRYRQRQIEELYGPLLSLIEQIFNTWQVRENIVTGGNPTPEQKEQIRHFFWQTYFYPLHQEIGALLKTKLYLLENGQMPASFADYLEHATQEACQNRLWDELHIDTSHVRGKPWPKTFHCDVTKMLDYLMKEHQSGIRDLK